MGREFSDVSEREMTRGVGVAAEHRFCWFFTQVKLAEDRLVKFVLGMIAMVRVVQKTVLLRGRTRIQEGREGGKRAVLIVIFSRESWQVPLLLCLLS